MADDQGAGGLCTIRRLPARGDPGETPVDLLCFAHAGGTPGTFAGWSELLPPWIRVSVAEYGALHRSPQDRRRSLLEVADAAAVAWAGGGWGSAVFYGHSLGALVALEAARSLDRRGAVCPELLLVAARNAPCVPDPSAAVRGVSDEDLVARLRTWGATPSVLLKDRAAMASLLPLIRADLEMAEGYVSAAPAPGPWSICAFGGDADPWTDHPGLRRWADFGRGAFGLCGFAGDHFFPRRSLHAVLAVVELYARQFRSSTRSQLPRRSPGAAVDEPREGISCPTPH